MGALEFLQSVYRDDQQPMDVRLKAAEIAVDYEIERCDGCGEPIEIEGFDIGSDMTPN